MTLFICDKCSGIENTAEGAIHRKDTGEVWSATQGDNSLIVALCTECTPPKWVRNQPAFTWHGDHPKQIATEELVREWGLWPHPLIGPHNGFCYLGKFEYLRPELQRQKRNAARRLKRKAAKGGP